MRPLVRTSTQELDGGYVSVYLSSGNGGSIRIPVGAYATPFWLERENGVLLKVSRLPFQAFLGPTSS